MKVSNFLLWTIISALCVCACVCVVFATYQNTHSRKVMTFLGSEDILSSPNIKVLFEVQDFTLGLESLQVRVRVRMGVTWLIALGLE